MRLPPVLKFSNGDELFACFGPLPAGYRAGEKKTDSGPDFRLTRSRHPSASGRRIGSSAGDGWAARCDPKGNSRVFYDAGLYNVRTYSRHSLPPTLEVRTIVGGHIRATLERRPSATSACPSDLVAIRVRVCTSILQKRSSYHRRRSSSGGAAASYHPGRQDSQSLSVSVCLPWHSQVLPSVAFLSCP
jgi:hypothetical protein